MFQFKSGVLDTTRLVSNILMLILLCGNLYFSIQYISNITAQDKLDQQQQAATSQRIQVARTLKDFINIVLNTNTTVSYQDRVKLEDDILQVNNPTVTADWQAFVASKSGADAQANAVKVISTLANMMI